MAANLSQDDDVISSINVTPLVDVVLVLLIIFMITAPVIYQSAIKVDLPAASTGKQNKADNQMTFTLAKDGEVYWGKDRMDIGQIESKLSQMTAANLENESAVINADEGTAHGKVIQLLDSLRKHGLTRIALTVQTQ